MHAAGYPLHKLLMPSHPVAGPKAPPVGAGPGEGGAGDLVYAAPESARPPAAVRMPLAQAALAERHYHRQRARGIRVVALVTAVAAISLADLHLTLSHLQGVGMGEANPLARFIMSYNCAWLLGAWKVMLAGLTCAILVSTRKHRSAEIAAWVACGICLWLLGRWVHYLEHAPTMVTPILHQVAEGNVPMWVRFDDTGGGG